MVDKETPIEEVQFVRKDGKTVKVSEYGDSWTQYGVATYNMLDPEFLDEFFLLMVKYKLWKSTYEE